MMFNSPNKLLAGIEAARAINGGVGRNVHEDLLSGRRQVESRSMNGVMRPIKRIQGGPGGPYIGSNNEE